MELEVDVKERSVSFTVSGKVYSRQAVEIAAHVLSSRADVLLGGSDDAFDLVLQAKRKNLGRPELEALAGEFVNELLNQEYRFVVGRFNQKISTFIVTQALLAARGGEAPAVACDEEKTPAFQARVAELMAAAEKEVARTMPKKLPPQGTPLPPAKEDAGA